MGFLDEKYLLSSEIAFALYQSVAKLPIIDAHNHANVAEIARNKNYSDPWQLFAATDHYVWEMLRKRGVPEDFITGSATPKEKWLRLSAVFPEIAGNPVYEWIHLDLRRYLGIETLLGPKTGEEIWEQAKAVLATKGKTPQRILKDMKVEIMCSTDDPIDLLEDHDRVNHAMKKTFIRPTWRPDKAMNICAPAWRDYIGKLEVRFNAKIKSISDLLGVLRESHDYFAGKGCRASDHGLEVPLSASADSIGADAVFKKTLAGEYVSPDECRVFMSHLLGEMAELDAQKDWVFQLHIGAVRDVRDSLFKKLGPDSGGDVSHHCQDFMAPLRDLLNRFDDRLKIVLYCLDAGHQATLATLARAFGSKVALGSAWWLNDTPVGMRRQLEYIGSVDCFSNFAGMVSDSRKLLSYGSRFEMFRRVLSDVIGSMVERGQIPFPVAEQLAIRMCYDNQKNFFNL